MSKTFRDDDQIYRYGGEEFAMLLPDTGLEEARVIAERLRVAVEKTDTVQVDDGTVVAFTVSIGVAALGTDEKTFDAMLQHADKHCTKPNKMGAKGQPAAAHSASAASALLALWRPRIRSASAGINRWM